MEAAQGRTSQWGGGGRRRDGIAWNDAMVARQGEARAASHRLNRVSVPTANADHVQRCGD